VFQRLSERLRPVDPVDREAGLTLVEVIVAMMVFAVISVGVAYSITNSLVITRESRARVIATNLAAQDIDLMRSQGDLKKIVSQTLEPQTLNGIAFTVTREVSAVTATDSTTTDDCGVPFSAAAAGSTAPLQYKRVEVRVTYDGQRPGTDVTADTLIAPQDRVSDPEKGTIIVSVKGASGAGTPGVTVAVGLGSTPDGAAVPTQPDATDGQGCTFALFVKPGNYSLTLSKAGYVSNEQKATPSTTVRVEAGKAATAKFSYDAADVYSVRFATNYVPASGQPSPVLPVSMPTTFAGSATAPVQLVVDSSKTVRLFPISSGYAAVAGATGPTCLSPDPGNWTTPVASTVAGAPPAGALGQAVPTTTVPTAISVPMGVVKVTTLPGLTYTLTAVQQVNGGFGEPGCSTSPAVTLTFPANATGTQTVALPYGSWVFRTALVGAIPITVSDSSVQLLTPGVKTGGNVVVLDPRKAAS